MDNTVYINFNSGINEPVVNKLMAVCAEVISQLKPETIYFLFASGGGNVDPGITLYNYLRALPCHLVMHNMASIDSVATVIFHAADERYASPYSTFLFHGITWAFGQNQTLFRSQIEEVRGQLIEAENKIAKIVSGRCALMEEEIRNLFLQGETKNTTFALEKRIVQEVREPKVPKDAKLLSFTA